jgi:hypothetical protein
MRSMASVTPFELLYPVFKNPGTSLLRVAFIANICIEFIHLSQTGSCPSPVRSVTIRTLQRPLDDPVVVGKIKFGLDVSMAREAEIGVFFLQQIFGDLICVNLMAVITTNGA